MDFTSVVNCVNNIWISKDKIQVNKRCLQVSHVTDFFIVIFGFNCFKMIMWLKIVANYLVVITAMLTLSHCSFAVKRTETMHLDLNDVDTLRLSNAYLTNMTHYTNRTIVKRSAPGAPGLPLAIVPSSLSHGPEIAETVELYMYRYPMIKAAHIGTQTFS